jgi:hypothetical protein
VNQWETEVSRYAARDSAADRARTNCELPRCTADELDLLIAFQQLSRRAQEDTLVRPRSHGNHEFPDD